MMESFSLWFQQKILMLPIVASEHGRSVDNLLTYVHYLMLVLFVGWSLFFCYTVYRFRQRKNHKADHLGVRSHMSNYLEVGVALVEVVLLIGFAVPLWAKVVADPPNPDEATVIQVMGRQFNWTGHYAGVDGEMGLQDPALSNASDPFGVAREDDPGAADDVVVQGTFVVPVNKPIIAHITSQDVIHSFAVKAMRVCQDAIPGMSIPVWFTPTRVGEYRITCAQLCGNSHYGMFGTLKVVSQEEYDRWLSEQSAKALLAGAAPVDYE